MCGIFGFITDNPSKENFKLFRRCMILSESRGKDATGIAYVKNDKIYVDKINKEASKYLKDNLPKFEEDISKSHVVIGHTRHGTVGDAKDNNNNHPIISNDWVMIHNGTCASLDKIKGYKYKGEVDSELYLAYIQEKGLEEGVSEIKHHSAAIALLNTSEPNKLRLFRHNQTLYIAYDDKSKTLFFASTDDILESALANVMVVFTTYQIKKMSEDYIYTVSHGPLSMKLSDKIEVKKSYPITYHSQGKTVYCYGGAGGYGQHYDEMTGYVHAGAYQAPTTGVGKDKGILPKTLIWREDEKWWSAAKDKADEDKAPDVKSFEDAEENEEFVNIIVFLDEDDEIIGYELAEESIVTVEEEANEQKEKEKAKEEGEKTDDIKTTGGAKA